MVVVIVVTIGVTIIRTKHRVRWVLSLGTIPKLRVVSVVSVVPVVSLKPVVTTDIPHRARCVLF